MQYQVKRTLLGKLTIALECPSCRASLTADAGDAGHEQACPECGAAFTVPGEESVRAVRDKQEHDLAERAERQVATNAQRREQNQLAKERRVVAVAEKKRSKQWWNREVARRTPPMDHGTFSVVVLGLVAACVAALALMTLQLQLAALVVIGWLLTWIIVLLQRLHSLAWRGEFDQREARRAEFNRDQPPQTPQVRRRDRHDARDRREA